MMEQNINKLEHIQFLYTVHALKTTLKQKAKLIFKEFIHASDRPPYLCTQCVKNMYNRTLPFSL